MIGAAETVPASFIHLVCSVCPFVTDFYVCVFTEVDNKDSHFKLVTATPPVHGVGVGGVGLLCCLNKVFPVPVALQLRISEAPTEH